MKIFNRRQREEGKPELVFTWLEIELQGGRLVVRMRLDSTCGIDPEESKWVSREIGIGQGVLLLDVLAQMRLLGDALGHDFLGGFVKLAALDFFQVASWPIRRHS